MKDTISTILDKQLDQLRVPTYQTYAMCKGKCIPMNKPLSQLGMRMNDLVYIHGAVRGGSINNTNMNLDDPDTEAPNPFSMAKRKKQDPKKPIPFATTTRGQQSSNNNPLVISNRPMNKGTNQATRETAQKAIQQISNPQHLARGMSTSLCEPPFEEQKHENNNLDVESFRQVKRKRGNGAQAIHKISSTSIEPQRTIQETSQRKVREPTIKSALQEKLKNTKNMPEQRMAVIVAAPMFFPDTGYYRRARAAAAHIASLSNQNPMDEDLPMPIKVAKFDTKDGPKLYIQYEEDQIDKVKKDLPVQCYSIPKVGTITGVVGPFDKKTTILQKRKMLELIPNIVLAADNMNRTRAFFAAAITSKHAMITFSETNKIDFRVDPLPTKSPFCKHCFREYHTESKGICPNFLIPFCKLCTMQGHVAESCNYQKFCANCNINGHSTFQCRNSRPQTKAGKTRTSRRICGRYPSTK